MSQIENVSRRRFLTGGIIAAGALVLGGRYYRKLSGGKLAHDTNADHATLHPSVYLGIDLDTLVLRHDAPGRRNGAVDADASGGEAVGCSGNGMRVGFARCGSSRDEPQSWLRRTCDRCREIAGPQKRRAEAQTKECRAVCRQRASELRPRGACDRESYLWHGWRVDGMVYASVEHPPVLGGKVKSYDDKEALKVRGVHQTVPIDPFQQAPGFQPVGGIAVIADNTWAAFQGRKKLNISWDNGPNETFNSDEYKNELRATSHNPCKVVRNIGDADAVFVKGGKVYEGDYYVPLMAHASMEPLVALAEF